MAGASQIPSEKPIEPALSRIGIVKAKLQNLGDIKSRLVVLKRLIGLSEQDIIKQGSEKVIIDPKNAEKYFESSLKNTWKGQRSVLILPLRKWFLDKKRAFEREKEKMEEIANKATSEEIECLDVKFESVQIEKGKVIGATEKIATRSQLQAILKERAGGDFEDAINGLIGIEDRKKLLSDFLVGMEALHRMGCVYGDLKPENCLVYLDSKGNISLKVTDFGKTQKVSGEGAVSEPPISGNLRFAPPEGRLSQKGEVFGAALMIIRTLEEALPGKTGESLIPIGKKDRDRYSALAIRRGVEKFIVEHRAFMGLDTPGLLNKIFKRLPRQARLTKQSKRSQERQSTLLSKYAMELTKRLEQEGIINSENRVKLQALLEMMLETDPKIRLTIEESREQFSQVSFGTQSILEK